MTPGTAPQARPPNAEDWPPATPPMPPYAAPPSVPEHDEQRLTAVRWSVGSAIALIVAMFGLTFAAAWITAWARAADLGQTAFTVVVGASLAGIYVFVLALVWRRARAHGARFTEAVGIRTASFGAMVGGALFATFVGRLAAGAWGLVLERFGVDFSRQDMDPSRLFPASALGIAMTFLVVVVLAPIAEEVVFRGVLLSALHSRHGAAMAIGVSSALFAALHVSVFAIPPVFALALVLGWLFVRTRSLTVCIVAHATFNGTGLVLLYLLHSAGVL